MRSLLSEENKLRAEQFFLSFNLPSGRRQMIFCSDSGHIVRRSPSMVILRMGTELLPSREGILVVVEHLGVINLPIS